MRLKEVILTLSVLSAFAVSAQQQRVSFQNTGDAIRYYEEMVGSLSQQVRTMQDENAKLAGTVSELQNRIQIMEQNIQSMRNEMQGVKQQYEVDKNDRARQIDKLADKIQKAAAPTQGRTAETVSSAAGEYDTYVVQQGATLSLISRATGVPVSEIRRVNHLKNDTIFQGQKLKIPRRNNK